MTHQILLVEDDAAIMETLSLFLNYEGYEVVKARNVESAIETLNSVRPDLVLLDYMLQGETAEPVVKGLRKKYGDSTSVILLTAADHPDEKGHQVGADLVVAKPFELDTLLKHVREALLATENEKPEFTPKKRRLPWPSEAAQSAPPLT